MYTFTNQKWAKSPLYYSTENKYDEKDILTYPEKQTKTNHHLFSNKSIGVYTLHYIKIVNWNIITSNSPQKYFELKLMPLSKVL